VLLGGINGLNTFEPLKVQSNSYAPPVHVTGVKIFNELLDETNEDVVASKKGNRLKEYHLNYDQNMITLHFAALNFIQSEKNLISYIMSGLDKDWSEPANVSKATYRNLPPGRYVFKVRASNNHGLWNPNTLRLRIIIKPPYYQTWWFYSSVTFLILLTLYVLYKIKVRSIKAQRNALEKQVLDRTEEIVNKTLLLEEKELRRIQSLNYAKLIQDAVLTSVSKVQNEVKDMFVLLKASEIVSGDFYWTKKIGDKLVVCAVDCTGHGVPGAFLSMMGNALLNKIITRDKVFSPAEIMERLHNELVISLNQKLTNVNDGMDMSIVVIDHKESIMTFSGAMNPLVYVQNGKMMYIRGTRRSIGGGDVFADKPFREHIIDISEETTFYLYSDGYQDQFGTSGSKYMSKRFRELLYYVHDKPMQEQKELLTQEHDTWRNSEVEQTDDILILGLKV